MKFTDQNVLFTKIQQLWKKLLQNPN